MPKIKILAVGKIKENYILEGIQEYMKRMRTRRLEIIELDDSTKEKEGEKILKRLEKLEGYMTIVLDEHGEGFTSIGFSEFMKKNLQLDICFIIGGPDGLDKSVLDKVDHAIALSQMTFTHEMVRLFLVEQLYRVFSIIEGKSYHRN